MDARPQAQPMDSEEALLAAQQSFVRSMEASSVQLKVKRPVPNQPLKDSAAASEKALSGARTPRVSWSPEVVDNGGPTATEGGATAIGTIASRGAAGTIAGGAGVGAATRPIKAFSARPTGPSFRKESGAAGDAPDEPRARVGAGADLTAGDDVSDDESLERGDGGGADPMSESVDRPPYEPLPTVGAIKEKGYGGAGAKDAGFVAQVPAPQATPFPEARHRSEGPHWAPVPQVVLERLQPEADSSPPFDPAMAIPLSRPDPAHKKAAMSKFRQAMLDSRKTGEPNSQPKDQRRVIAGPKGEVARAQAANRGDTFEGANIRASAGNEESRLDTSYGKQAALRSRSGGEGTVVEQSGAPAPSLEEEAIDRENRARLAGMSAAEVAAEQAELQQMLPPGVLEALRKRGARKLGAGGHDEARSSLVEKKLDISQELEETSAVKSAGARTEKPPLRRQPTPLPGAIPSVQKGPPVSLGAISEDGGVEVASGDTAIGISRGKEDLKAPPERVTPAEGTPLRRQPTPLPGAIPKAVKSGGATLDSLAEDEGETGDDSGAGSRSTGERLLRQPTPMPGAILQHTPQRKPELGVLIEEDGDEPAADEMEEGLLSTEEEVSGPEGASVGRADELQGALARQPTPLPGAIPVVKGLREPVLAPLEESPEDEEDEARAEVCSAGAAGTSGRLARQPTPLPGAIPSPRTKPGAALATLEEEEGEEDTGEEREERPPGQPTDPVPSSSGVPEPSLHSASESEREPGAKGVSASSFSHAEPRVSPLMFAPVNASDMRFDLDGALLAPEPGGPGSADVTTKVAERDILRSEGDPSGTGYSLQEAAKLARSTVPSQRAAALRLIAGVLRKAVGGMHGGEGAESDERGLWRGVWARVWAYALGPNLQLAVVLRSALDDSHATVLAAAAHALLALLTGVENETNFEDAEAVWRSPHESASLFTGPCDRSSGVLTAGVSSWGRWAARASVDTSAAAEGDEVREETVGDDARVAAGDVVVGLIRMGILPRIRFILEVLSLPALDEPLLATLVTLARHSAAAARAVRDCPRLLPTLRGIFVGVLAPAVRSPIPSHTAQETAVKLLTMLCLADRASAALVSDTGLLSLAKRHLVSRPRAPLRFPPAFSRVLRLWRTCALYGRGGGSLSDYYGALAVVLEPPAGDRAAAEAAPWGESAEAYLLLEALARTLPSGREDESADEERAEVLLDWATVGPLVETATKWLSPGVLGALPETRTSPGGAAPLHALAAAVHFLATVAERNAGQLGRLERALVDALLVEGGGLRTAASHTSPSREGKRPVGDDPRTEREVAASGRVSYFEFLSERVALGGNDDGGTLAAASCLQGLLRLTSALAARERLGATAAERAAGPILAGRSGTALEAGGDKSSLSSIEGQMMLSFGGLAERLTDVLVRGGAWEVQEEEQRPAAAGLGLGWGLPARGVWGEGLAVRRARAGLLASLYETFPLNSVGKGDVSAQSAAAVPEPSTSGRDTAAEGKVGGAASRQAIRRLRAALAAIRTMGPGNFESVLALLSSAILSTDVLEVLLAEGGALLQSVRSGSQSGRGSLPSAAEVRRVLLPHFAGQWLGRWTDESDEGGGADGWDIETEVNRLLDADGTSERAQASEGRSGGSLSGRINLEPSRTSTSGPGAALAVSISGQKLLLPADWLLSPTAVAAQLSSSAVSEEGSGDIEDGVKQLVRAGLALLLGLEACERLERPEGQSKDSKSGGHLLGVPLVRKLHALSEAFLAAGELFLDSDVAPLLQALQELYGRELPPVPADENAASADAAPEAPPSDNSAMSGRRDQRALDFAVATGAPYEGFAEGLAEQFAATSFGDPAFGRQVVLLLREDVTPGALRLVVWKALADARALHLLPPARDCLGDPRAYLPALAAEKDALEQYAAALRSGALDRTIALGPEGMSVTALIALHHLGAALDDTAGPPGENGGRGAGSSAPSSAPGPVHTDDGGRERQEPGAAGGAEAEKKRGVQGLVQGWLWSAAQGRCDANTVAAFVAHAPASPDSVSGSRRSSRRVAALVEAAGGDSTLVSLLQGLGMVDPGRESAAVTE
ncbi:hypothetical protein KFL_004450060 [Klebsormidium nitens]|uniref:RNA polymerase II-associated protein 1 C-terminal domain-containing protein n=1 Tax=Klebsormidium nitens TaxID=105231 RepID=A0A1Y1IGJ8_KLENI|nr:hypothetical protein KFL_004450060 [Klebsormidium nitens]|eukprot:GAQ88619.1 hypothetical protein KFL_004450060 [Klebsormidium nitens]